MIWVWKGRDRGQKLRQPNHKILFATTQLWWFLFMISRCLLRGYTISKIQGIQFHSASILIHERETSNTATVITYWQFCVPEVILGKGNLETDLSVINGLLTTRNWTVIVKPRIFIIATILLLYIDSSTSNKKWNCYKIW